jgi:hypothetical protein
VYTHAIITTIATRRGLMRRRVVEKTVVTEVETHSTEELGRITRAVLTALDDALPEAYVTSRPEPISPPARGQ